ncbi:PREDICTED: killer cell immunoglobulin-like receptor 2DS4 [Galeopterus variegatus]|uniref:Killer cell immunoglobulin-like receptor 2DS4 n=1 Tax=Galeopterus variegatus TaxID=482537 RepID=A0ABM0SK14_GALVR|nr:PREDICTED: killer cell immunoglobulin-like receptor 2DS4 [Galeopterus variegatus]
MTGGHTKPSLSAWPSSVVPQGSRVVIQCDSSLQFLRFRLYKEDGGHIPGLQDKTFRKTFLIHPVTPAHGGTYRCYLHTHYPNSLLAPSDPLVITVTGVYRKPSLLAQLGTLVKSGGNLTLQCFSEMVFEKFILVQHRSGATENTLYLAGELHHGSSQANFSMNPVTSAHAGTYNCYGSVRRVSPSKLAISLFLGVYRKPSLLAQLGTLVKSGGNLTLQCFSEMVFEKFILVQHRSGATENTLHLAGELHHGSSQANFSMNPVTSAHAGTYRCYGSVSHSPYEWSAPSDPLDIVITGLYEKPSLSAQPGPMVMSGENVTLSCGSKSSFDMYHLSGDGEAPERRRPAVWSRNGTFQADFAMGPMTTTHCGTYRCYGSFSGSSYLWSAPSDPTHLSITGNSSSCCPSPTESSSKNDNSSSLHVLIGPSVVTILLAILLFFLIRRWCPAKKNAAMVGQEPEVNRTVKREDPKGEDPQEVTYAQLDHWIFTRKKITPTSRRPKEPSTDTSMYVELAKS